MSSHSISIMKKRFWERRKFFDSYGKRPNEQMAGMPPRGVRLTCPCCGYPMLSSSGDYEICRLCSWEDDGQDDPDADLVRGGPNSFYSLVEARENFELYLVKHPPEVDPRVGGPDTERKKEIKRAMMAAFDQLMESPAPGEIQNLWQQIYEHEQALDQELKRDIWGPLYDGIPCPYCGSQLRTRLAKQCRKCGKDWHDPDNIIQLDPI